MRKNPRPKQPNAFSGITNLYANADGIMHNEIADSRLQATITSNQLKHCSNWVYGSTPHLRSVSKKTKQQVGSTVVQTVKRFADDKTVDLIMDDGEIIPASDLDRKGVTVSAFLQMSKYKT
jgi:hypothetical protein